MKDLVRIRINRAVQPELPAVEAGHILINRELTLGNGRNQL